MELRLPLFRSFFFSVALHRQTLLRIHWLLGIGGCDDA